MRSFIINGLVVASVAQAYAKEPVTTYSSNTPGFVDGMRTKVNEGSVHGMATRVIKGSIDKWVDKLADKLIDKLFGQKLKALPLHNHNLINATLGKPGMTFGRPGRLAVLSRMDPCGMGLKSFPPLPFMRGELSVPFLCGGIKQHLRSRTVRDVTVKQQTEADQWEVGTAKWERSLFGEDLGARNKTEGEQVTDFGSNEAVMEDWDTLHEMLVPKEFHFVAGFRKWEVSPENVEPLHFEPQEADFFDNYATQLAGWILLQWGADSYMLRKDFPYKDAACAKELETRINYICQYLGHRYGSVENLPDELLPEGDTVRGPVLRVQLHGASRKNTLCKMDLTLAAWLKDMYIEDISPMPEWMQLQIETGVNPLFEFGDHSFDSPIMSAQDIQNIRPR